MNLNVTRRTAVKAAGMALAGGACAMAASQALASDAVGAPCAAYANPDEIGIVHDASSEEEFAAVFVGTGIGGMMGAMICAEQMPNERILLIDKLGGCGGNTNYAEKNEPRTSTPWEEAYRAALETSKASGYIKDAHIIAARAAEYGENSGWLYVKHGIGVHRIENKYPMYEGGTGALPIQKLQSEIENDPAYANLELRLNTRATALLLDDPYTCTGVQIQNADGTYTNVHAQAVVLATGGVSTNFDLLQYYCGQDLSKCDAIGQGQDGDGHLMVEQTAHGRCKSITLSSMYVHVEGLSLTGSMLSSGVSMNPTALMVNQDGVRFINESEPGDVQYCKLVELEGRTYSIASEGMLDYLQNGGQYRLKTITGFDVSYEPYDGSSDLAEGLELGSIVKADTLEELAEKIDVPADALVATVARYDADAEAGEGDTFLGKAPEHMIALGEGPYYAFKLLSCILNTNNGIRVNTNAQVVDPQFKPVEGLYAAGIAVSGFNAEVYTSATSQSSSVWAGSKAARHLIENRCGYTVADDWYGEEFTLDSLLSYDDGTVDYVRPPQK